MSTIRCQPKTKLGNITCFRFRIVAHHVDCGACVRFLRNRRSGVPVRQLADNATAQPSADYSQASRLPSYLAIGASWCCRDYPWFRLLRYQRRGFARMDINVYIWKPLSRRAKWGSTERFWDPGIIGFVVVLLFVVAVFLSSDSERGLGARQSEKPRS